MNFFRVPRAPNFVKVLMENVIYQMPLNDADKLLPHAAHQLGRPWLMVKREADYVARASQALTQAGANHAVR